MNSSTEQKQLPSEYRANLEILMQIPLFSGLPLEPLKLLAYLCKREGFKPGEIIFQQQELDTNAYYIIRGRAWLTVENIGGEQLREYGESDFIGGISLFCDMKRLFTLKAESATTCLVLSKEKFQKTLEQFPEIGRKMFEALLKSVYEWESRSVMDHALRCPECRDIVGVSLV